MRPFRSVNALTAEPRVTLRGFMLTAEADATSCQPAPSQLPIPRIVRLFLETTQQSFLPGRTSNPMRFLLKQIRIRSQGSRFPSEVDRHPNPRASGSRSRGCGSYSTCFQITRYREASVEHGARDQYMGIAMGSPKFTAGVLCRHQYVPYRLRTFPGLWSGVAIHDSVISTVSYVE